MSRCHQMLCKGVGYLGIMLELSWGIIPCLLVLDNAL